MKVLLFCLTSMLMLFQPAFSYELHVNCGGDSLNSRDYGFPFGADTGFSGGETYRTQQAHLMIDTIDRMLYCTGRKGCFAYSFPVTPGWYILRLGFSETILHATGQRVLSVICEGDTILKDLDILTHRRGFYPVVFAKAVEVIDPQIDIEFAASDS